jgi:LysM repeat protein
VPYQFVHLSSGDEGESVTTKSHPKPTALSRKNTTATAAKQSQKKVKGDVLGSPKIKREISVTSSDDEITIVAPSTTNSDDFIFLPAFARAGWSTRFLPTLNHRLARALDPWDIGDGVDILVIFQGVLVKAFPGTTYEVRHNDKIYAMVRKSIRRLKTVPNLFTGKGPPQRQANPPRPSGYQNRRRLLRTGAIHRQTGCHR